MSATRLPALALLLTLTLACSSAERAADAAPRFTGPYLGRTLPGPEPEIFDSGELTGDARLFNITFSPSGDELFFSYNKSTPEGTGPDYEIRHMRREGDVWLEPETAWFSGTYSDCDLTFSPSGDRIFFASALRPHPVTGPEMDIYMLVRSEDGWSEPIHLGNEVNTEYGEVHASLARSGNLYFRSNRPGGHGDDDIWRARWVDGAFTDVRNLGSAINTEFMETDCFVAPDESYLLYNTVRPEHGTKPQIYVSFLRADGSWTTGQSLGSGVNCESGTLGSVVSPDGKVLFYKSRCSGEVRIHWVSTEIIYRLRDELLPPEEAR